MTFGNWNRAGTDVRKAFLASSWIWLLAVWNAAAATHTISMSGTRFVPSDLTIAVGDTVVWPGGSTVHTVTGTGGDAFCGNTWIYGGNNCVKTFSTAGTFTYRCNFHGTYGMTGTIRVVSPPTTSITSPATNAVFATDQTFEIRATASTLSGSITNLIFRTNAVALGSLTNTPYTLVVSNFTAGAYTLTTLATDSRGTSATSAPVAISVVTPVTPALTNATVLTNGQYQLQYSANAGLRYILQGSTNLVNWVSIQTNLATTNLVTFADASATNFTFRFYRVQRVR